MSTPARSDFFITGGTLNPRAASYVRRAADEELYLSLKDGQLCYVLTSRQMGKSSLFSQGAYRLKQEGYHVCFFELTSIGINVTVEQWYNGMLERVGDQFDLEDRIDEFRDANANLGPQQMWLEVLRRVVLKELDGPIVIVVDEIDIVRSLPFGTDEFFAGIRELYNGRAGEPELHRLCFCLLGVASPGDLILDKRLTPFNIGRRIEVSDFSEEESLQLAHGLTHVDSDVAMRLARRVHYWTGGQPYLTQRLCRAAAEVKDGRSLVVDESGVDRVCKELFSTLAARESDPNLTFVRDRILKINTAADREERARQLAEVAAQLDLYRSIYKGHRARDDDVNPAVTKLKLAGIIRGRGGVLEIKNPIYRQNFDLRWVRDNYPVNWRKRLQRAAIATAAVLLFACLPLAVWALMEAASARKSAGRADSEREKVKRLLQTNQDLLGKMYQREHGLSVANHRPIEAELLRLAAVETMKLAPSLFAKANEQPAIDDSEDKAPAFDPVRSFMRPDWSWSVKGSVTQLIAATDGSGFWYVTKEKGGEAHLRYKSLKVPAQQFERPAIVSGADLQRIAWSPDGRLILGLTDAGEISIWDAATGKLNPKPPPLEADKAKNEAAAWSPDNRRFAALDEDGQIVIWDMESGASERGAPSKETTTSVGNGGWVLEWSPDGKRLAASNRSSELFIWDAAEIGNPPRIVPAGERIFCLAWSPDSSLILTGDLDLKGTRVWQVTTGDEASPRAADGPAGVTAVAWSPDGKQFVTGDSQGNVRLRSFPGLGLPPEDLFKASRPVTSIFWKVPQEILIASLDDKMRKYDLHERKADGGITALAGSLWETAVSPDGKRVCGGDAKDAKTIVFFDVRGWRQLSPRSNQTPPAVSAESIVAANSPRWPDMVAVALNTDESPQVTLRSHDTQSGELSMVSAFPPDGVQADSRPASEPKLGAPEGIAVSQDGRRIAVGYNAGMLEMFDVSSDLKLTRRFMRQLEKNENATLRHLAFVQHDRLLLAGEKTFSAYASNDGMLNSSDGLNTPLAASPDGYSHLGGGDKSVIHLSVTAEANASYAISLAKRQGGDNSPTCISYAPDGTWAAIGLDDGSVRIDRGRRFLEANRSHESAVTAICVLPDGAGLISADAKGELRAWRVLPQSYSVADLGKDYDSFSHATGLDMVQLIDRQVTSSTVLTSLPPPSVDPIVAAYWAAYWESRWSMEEFDMGQPQVLEPAKLEPVFAPLRNFHFKFKDSAADREQIREVGRLLGMVDGKPLEFRGVAGGEKQVGESIELTRQMKLYLWNKYGDNWLEKLSGAEKPTFFLDLTAVYGERLRAVQEGIRETQKLDRAADISLPDVWKPEYEAGWACLERALALGSKDWGAIREATVFYEMDARFDKVTLELAEPAQLLERANKLSKNEPERAIRCLEAYRTKGGNLEYTDAFNFGILLRDNKRIKEAYELHDLAEKTAGTDERRARVKISRAYTMKVDKELKDGQADADAEADRAVKTAPKELYPWKYAALIQAETKEGYARAIEILRAGIEAVERGENNILLQLQLAGFLFKLADRRGAQAALDAAMKNDPSPEAYKAYWTAVATNFENAEEQEAGLRILGRGIEAVRGDKEVRGWLYSRRGAKLREMNRLLASIPDFQASLALKQEVIYTHAELGDLFRRLGDYERAEMELVLATGPNSDDHWAWARRGDLWLDRGDQKRALEYYTRARDLYATKDAEGYAEAITWSYAQAGEFQNAHSALSARAAVIKERKVPKSGDLTEKITLKENEGLICLTEASAAQTAGETTRATILRSSAEQCFKEAAQMITELPKLTDHARFTVDLGLRRWEATEKEVRQDLVDWPDTPDVYIRLASLFAQRKGNGDQPLAIAALAEACSREYYDAPSLRRTIFLAPLREDSDFKELLGLLSYDKNMPSRREELLATFIEKRAAKLPAGRTLHPNRASLRAAVSRLRARAAQLNASTAAQAPPVKPAASDAEKEQHPSDGKK